MEGFRRTGARVFGFPVGDLAYRLFRNACLPGDLGPHLGHRRTQLLYDVLDSFGGGSIHTSTITHIWDLINPQMGRDFVHSPGMKKKMPLEQILAENLSALMASNVGLNTIDKLAKRSGVGRGTIDRVKKGEVSTKLETVEKLAEAFGVPVVALLTQYEEPGLLQAGADVSEKPTDERALLANSLSAVCETAAEQRLLTAYRISDAGGRGGMDAAADAALLNFQRSIGHQR